MIRDSQKKAVINYYQKGHADYSLIYFRRGNYSMNYGYWDETTKNRDQALYRLYEVIQEKLGAQSHHHLLDAGSGLGEASFWFASKTGCKVTGVTLSPKHVSIAKNRLDKSPDKNISFLEMDYTQTTFKYNTFDFIIAIETICHLEDKADFYQEAYRILKPGGKLLVVEYGTIDNIPPENQRSMKIFSDGWAIPNIWPTSKHTHTMNRIGFKNVRSIKFGKNTDRTSLFMYVYSILGIPIYKILNFFGLIGSTRMKNALACRHQYLTKKAGVWDHHFFIGEK